MLKKIRKLLFSKYFPAFIRKKIIRNQLCVDLKLLLRENIIIKVAETRDELFQALSLVQKMYEKNKIIDKNTTGLRITKFHLLPTTTVIVAKRGEEVIGTFSQIMDTPLGLPIDDFTSLKELRKKSKRVCEISSLAICEKWRSKTNGLFIPLSLFAIMYARKFTGADKMVIVTNERARFVYEDIFLFEHLTVNSTRYESVNDDRAFAQYLNLEKFEKDIFNIYAEESKERNIFKMYYAPDWVSQLSVDHLFYQTVPLMNYDRDTLDYFFKELGMLNDLTDSEKQVIYNHYSIYDEGYGKNLYISQRRFQRHYCRMRVDIHIKEKIVSTECIELSRGGASILLPIEGEVERESILPIEVYFNAYLVCHVTTRVVWIHGNKFGVEVMLNQVQSWYYHIDQLEQMVFSSRKPA